MSHYKAALFLAVVFAFVQIAWVAWFGQFRTSFPISELLTMAGLSIAIVAGLWVHSKFVQYAGAILLLGWTAMLLWSFTTIRPALNNLIPKIYLFIFVVVSITLVGILLLSKKFRNELTLRRNT